jgi:hypothetical protein
LNDTITTIYEQSKEGWIGCDWVTQFGTARLNLKDVTARQAELLARATCGHESTQWRVAAEYLARIEADALAAQHACWIAMQEVNAGRLDEALAHVERACELERPYHTVLLWEPFYRAIQHRRSNGG